MRSRAKSGLAKMLWSQGVASLVGRRLGFRPMMGSVAVTLHVPLLTYQGHISVSSLET